MYQYLTENASTKNILAKIILASLYPTYCSRFGKLLHIDMLIRISHIFDSMLINSMHAELCHHLRI